MKLRLLGSLLVPLLCCLTHQVSAGPIAFAEDGDSLTISNVPVGCTSPVVDNETTTTTGLLAFICPFSVFGITSSPVGVPERNVFLIEGAINTQTFNPVSDWLRTVYDESDGLVKFFWQSDSEAGSVANVTCSSINDPLNLCLSEMSSPTDVSGWIFPGLNVVVTIQSDAEAPVPPSAMLLVLGLAVLGWVRRDGSARARRPQRC